MKKLIIILFLLSVYAYGQCCFSGPISTRIGIKTGLNYGIFNRDNPETPNQTEKNYDIHLSVGFHYSP